MGPAASPVGPISLDRSSLSQAWDSTPAERSPFRAPGGNPCDCPSATPAPPLSDDPCESPAACTGWPAASVVPDEVLDRLEAPEIWSVCDASVPAVAAPSEVAAASGSPGVGIADAASPDSAALAWASVPLGAAPPLLEASIPDTPAGSAPSAAAARVASVASPEAAATPSSSADDPCVTGTAVPASAAAIGSGLSKRPCDPTSCPPPLRTREGSSEWSHPGTPGTPGTSDLSSARPPDPRDAPNPATF